MAFSQSQSQLETEASRLYGRLHHVGWTRGECDLYAPLTLEINALKKAQNAVILAHSYQTPDIMYGVADFVGDSYGLSRIATEHPAEKIVFCSVHFMGETAKLLNPDKEVLVPAIAGCSLADSITPEDVRALRKKYPEAGVVCYVNTSAAVKAECDVCCTSANVVRIIGAMPQQEVIFVPDEYMGRNMQDMTSKTVHLWTGKCVVHETFTPETVQEVRAAYPGVKILAHTECSPSVIQHVDMAGSTSDMMKYVQENNDDTVMLITECGITDRVRTEFPDKTVVGTCSLCPYMKEIQIKDILTALKSPTPEQIISIPEDIATRARATLDRMYELEKMVKAS